jgi:transposase
MAEVTVIGIDICKSTFHAIGLNQRGAIVLRKKWARRQLADRLANLPSCLIDMEACVGGHHLARQCVALGHDARLMPAKYVKPYSKGQKNDFRDAEAIAEAVQRPTMRFVAIKSIEQLELQALHRVRQRLISQRTRIINQIRAFLLERGIAVRQGQRYLRSELPILLASRQDALSPRMLRMVEDLATDWRGLDARIDVVTEEITALAQQDAGAERLMSAPGIGPIISSAMVAATGAGEVFAKGRDFAAWLGLVPKQISTGDRTILGPISRRGNRYLRTLFVQAAWVVLVRPQSWERHGLKSWIEAGKKRLHHNVLAIALPTNWPELPGPRWPRDAGSPRRGKMMCPNPGAVLGPVKVWPGRGGDRGYAAATANLDQPCARLPRRSAGRDEGKATSRTRESLLRSQ